VSVTTSLTRRSWFFPVFPHPAVGHPLPLPQARESALSPRSGGIARRPSSNSRNWNCQRTMRQPMVGYTQVFALDLGAPASRRLVKARNEETRRRDAGAPRPDVPVPGFKARRCVRGIRSLGEITEVRAGVTPCCPQRRGRDIFVESAGKQNTSPVEATYSGPATIPLLRSCGCFRITFYKDAAPLVLPGSKRDSVFRPKIAEPARLPCDSPGFDFAPEIHAA